MESVGVKLCHIQGKRGVYALIIKSLPVSLYTRRWNLQALSCVIFREERGVYALTIKSLPVPLYTALDLQASSCVICREERGVYALTIIAEDGEVSSLLKNGRPNQTPQKFRIVIKDKNDNPPYFPQQVKRPTLLPDTINAV